MTAPPEVIAAAREYFEQGYQVVAVKANKAPWGKNWRRAHTPDEVLKLLEEADCPAIGFLGGELNHGIVPIDFDTAEGDKWFCTQCEAVGIDPFEFPMVVTPGKVGADGKRRQGFHRYVTDIRGTLGNATGPLLAELGIDVRGRGHAMLPPSPHPDGGTYQWMLAHSLLTDFPNGVPPCPLFLYEAIEARYGPEGAAEAPAEPAQGNGADPAPDVQFRAPPPPGGSAGAPGGRGANYEARIKAYLQNAIANARDRLAAVTESQPLPGGRTRGRNAALNNEALGLGHWAHHGIYTSGQALSALMAACETSANGGNDLLKDDGTPQCHETFWSGWNKGLAEPRELKDDEPPKPGFGAGSAWTGDWSADSTDYTQEESKSQKDTGADSTGTSQRQEAGGAKEATDEGIGEFDAGDLEGSLPPPRGWLLGNVFARQFISSLLAAGGTGKTAVRIAQALALASGQNLTDEHVFVRSRVLYVCLEDDRDELWRRILAAMKHHHLEFADIRGWLFLATPSLHGWRLAHVDNRQVIEGQLGPRLEATIVRRKIDLIILDPFVKSHGVDENDNNKIDFVANILAKIAYRHDCALDVPHHIAKGMADPGNSDKGRGASALRDAFRLGFTLAPMSPEEAETIGIGDVERRFLIRMDSAKVNISPPLEQAKWFKLISVAIGNANETYPAGDQVQTVEVYRPLGIWHDVSPMKAREILLFIDKGLPDGRRYSSASAAKEDIAAWRVVQDRFPDKNQKQCRSMVAAWLKSGVLEIREYHNPVSREEARGLFVIRAKLPSGEAKMPE